MRSRRRVHVIIWILWRCAAVVESMDDGRLRQKVQMPRSTIVTRYLQQPAFARYPPGRREGRNPFPLLLSVVLGRANFYSYE